MSEYPHLEVVSGELTAPQIQMEEEAVVQALGKLAITEVRVEVCKGWAYIPTAKLLDVMRQGLPKEVARPYEGMLGTIDFTIVVEGQNLEYEFCHHGELHIRADEEQYLQPFLSRWNHLGYKTRRRQGEEWENGS